MFNMLFADILTFEIPGFMQELWARQMGVQWRWNPVSPRCVLRGRRGRVRGADRLVCLVGPQVGSGCAATGGLARSLGAICRTTASSGQYAAPEVASGWKLRRGGVLQLMPDNVGRSSGCAVLGGRGSEHQSSGRVDQARCLRRVCRGASHWLHRSGIFRRWRARDNRHRDRNRCAFAVDNSVSCRDRNRCP